VESRFAFGESAFCFGREKLGGVVGAVLVIRWPVVWVFLVSDGNNPEIRRLSRGFEDYCPESKEKVQFSKDSGPKLKDSANPARSVGCNIALIELKR
jgi:hypothetical protein